MIEPMMQVSLIFPQVERDQVLVMLQKEALVHLDFAQSPSESLGPLQEYLRQVKSLLELYPPAHFHQARSQGNLYDDIQSLKQLSRIHESLVEAEKELDRLQHLRQRTLPYGNFDAASLQRLEQAGIHLHHYRVKDREKKHLQGLDWFRLFRSREQDYGVVVSRNPNLDLPLQKLSLPELGLAEVDRRIAEQTEKVARTKIQLDAFLQDPTPLQHLQWELENLLHFEMAKAQAQEQASLAWVTGYCPADQVSSLKNLAERAGFAALIQPAPLAPETPIRLKHNPLTKLFKPILGFIGVLPGYDEKDANGLFLLFFTLFFAVLVGDAAYGAIMFGTAYYLHRKHPKWPKEVFKLFYLLSGATIVWGAVTGMWFGHQALVEGSFLRHLVVPSLYSFAEDSDPLIMQLAFLVGLVQLLLAHSWELMRAPTWAMKATEAAWMLFLLGCYHLALLFLLKTPVPTYAVVCLYTGLGMVVLFGEQRGGIHPLKGLALGLANLPLNFLNAVGFFSDLVSYIRLFALGMASKEMAVAANQLALQAGMDEPLGLIAGILILILGHGINITLAAMAVMVHGIRLNFLEFARHLNMQWRGRPFVAFARTQKTY